MKRSMIVLCVSILTFVVALPVSAGIANSPHDLSSESTAAIKATNDSNPETNEDQICVFCHTPHNALTPTPLWNRGTPSPESGYKLYANADTIDGTISPIGGTSLMCLSCHDGTIALGSYANVTMAVTEIAGRVESGKLVGGGGYLGTDLSNDHPVSITYVPGSGEGKDAELKPDSEFQWAQLFQDKVECASCHDVHNNQFGNFLPVSNTGSQLCLDCHIK